MKSFKVTDFNSPLQEVDEPTPQPSGTQVLIKVKAAGVCHSDLHIWEGGYELGHGRKPLSLKDRGVPLPRTMGHESAGEIVAFGPDVKDADKGGLKVGDVVLVYPWLGCGKCATCLAGDENMCIVKPNALGVYCDGGYADHMTVPHPKYLLNLKGLDPVTAAPYACSGVTTYSALKKVEADFNTPIVIFGAGGLGLMALSLLKAMGGKGAIVVDIDARKREAAEAGRRARDRRRRRAGCAGAVRGSAGGPIRAVIDLVGNPATTQLGFDCLTKGGKLVIVGLFGGGATWALPLIPIKADHHPGQLCRQSARDRGTARSRAHQEDRADPGDADAARQSQRGAGRSAAGQAGRPRDFDAVIPRHCEERSDEAIRALRVLPWIASLRSQ